MKITKQIEWDMGHRIPNHKSICRNLHGHRYKLEVCLQGELIDIKDSSSESMVYDFGEVKSIIAKEIVTLCDHSFMFWEKDKQLTAFFKKNQEFKYLKVSFIPTAEEISKWIYQKLNKSFKDLLKTELTLHYVKLWETPTSTAIYTRKDFIKSQKLK